MLGVHVSVNRVVMCTYSDGWLGDRTAAAWKCSSLQLATLALSSYIISHSFRSFRTIPTLRPDVPSVGNWRPLEWAADTRSESKRNYRTTYIFSGVWAIIVVVLCEHNTVLSIDICRRVNIYSVINLIPIRSPCMRCMQFAA